MTTDVARYGYASPTAVVLSLTEPLLLSPFRLLLLLLLLQLLILWLLILPLLFVLSEAPLSKPMVLLTHLARYNSSPRAVVRSTTIRPRTAPARIRGASAGRAERLTVCVIASSRSAGRSRASRRQASTRSSRGHITESIPSRLTPRSRNGITVAGRSLPPVTPPSCPASTWRS